MDSPGQCKNLEAQNITSESCLLHWQAPDIDGGAAVTSYTVEKKETSRLIWTTVKENINETKLNVSQDILFC